MRELRLIWGWILQIIGMFFFPIAIGTFFFLAFLQRGVCLESLSFSPVSLSQNPTIYLPLIEFVFAIMLTWIGIRLWRNV